MEELALLSRSWPEPRRMEEQRGPELGLGTGGEAGAATATWSHGSGLAGGGVGQAGREGRPRENPLERPQDPSPHDTALLAPARPSVLAHEYCY